MTRTPSRILACLIGALSVFTALAQSPNSLENLRNVLPPSPNSSEFAKYGNWPVSLYTGVPNISVPVSAVMGRTISVPITLSYHAAGNHVGDIASWVGLGWSLSTGGVISRSVRGLNDEDGFFQYSSYYSDPNNLSSTVPYAIDQNRLVGVAKSIEDSEQDSYNFSAMGKSYRLLLLADGTVQTIPRSNIKFIANPIVGGSDWTVLMEDGTKMIFGGTGFEETTVNPTFHYSTESSGLNYVSSWMLKSITTATGEVVNFSYSPSAIEQDNYFSQSDFIKYKTSNGVTGSVCLNVENAVLIKSVYSIQQVASLNPTAIESDLYRVEFLTTPDRQDLYGGVALSQIKVYSKITNEYTELYTFNTSYTESIGSDELLGGTAHSSSYFRKRLRLNSFERKDITNPTQLPEKWTFEYNPQNLPSRRSFAQDHWGYFNGATTNSTLLPKVYFQLPNLPTLQFYRPFTGFMPGVHILGANRDGDVNYMQAEILNRIKYPTGGYSEFEYEANSIIANKETFTDTNITRQLNLTMNSGPTDHEMTGSFTVTEPTYVVIDLTSQINLDDAGSTKVTASIRDNANNLWFSTVANGKTWVNIPNSGDYTFKISVNTNASSLAVGQSVTGTLVLTYPKSNGVSNVKELTGGLRAKSIKDYDGDSSLPRNTQYFEYANPLVINNVDTRKDYMTLQSVETINQATGEQCYFINATRNSSTKFASGSIQGGTTGYGQVTTLNSLSGVNGKTVNIFSNVPDDSLSSAAIDSYDSHEFPYPPKLSRDIRRGLLLSQKLYSAQGILVQQTNNTYEFSTVSTVICYKAGYGTIVGQCFNEFANCGIVRVYYAMEAEQVKNLTSMQIAYDANGQNTLTTSTTNYYDNPLNTQPVRVTSVDSQGKVITINTRTALEKSAIDAVTPLSSEASAAIDAMLNKNMVSQSIQYEKLLNSSLVDRVTNNYSTWGGTLILPKNSQMQTGSSQPRTTLTIHNYDANGNLLQLTPSSGVDKKVIWDYKNSMPVAEIINAGQGGVAFTSFESDGNGNWTWTNNSSPINSTVSFTGKKSYNLTANTISMSGLTNGSYTVSLWAKAGATININGLSVTGGPSVNGWIPYNKVVTTSTITITGSGFVDEVRLCPSTAQMTSYTYSPYGVTSTVDVNNIPTFYEYDGFGRLALVRDEEGNILKSHQYNYKIVE